MDGRAVIFANGEIPAVAQINPLLKDGDYLIAADGGLHHIFNLEKTPQLLIGDLDSVSADEVERASSLGVEVRRFKVDKDDSDLQLALLAAAAKGFKEILVFAALGGRLDHTLTNLFLLALPELSHLKVTVENGEEEIFLIRDKAEILGRPGDTLSLIPLQGEVKGVETRALKYPLKQETLFPEKSRGISNIMLADRAGVSIESGFLLCIHTRKGISEDK